jgi:hypothetical protein
VWELREVILSRIEKLIHQLRGHLVSGAFFTNESDTFALRNLVSFFVAIQGYGVPATVCVSQ